ncbi:hypothetical protein FHS76_000703 [Ochrobactrum daejeonense]|uniref:Uncharacterized protein n=1 Tax=Brucella daejeonensis TaxID=659015 RepID=A0A7W9ELA6_9HYPH|nr:hypothetical protein [Brucella daejeonensis]MBB5700860.1 hypothetical protein [Brucella daejeonensis]
MTRGHAALRSSSRTLIALLSFLFLVSTQLCYAMAHDVSPASPVFDMQESVAGHMDHVTMATDSEKAAPTDHGVKSPNACVMITCGGMHQIGAGLHMFVPIRAFGLPPLVAALSGSALQTDLRPPILRT